MDIKKIEETVEDILVHDGSDGHCDGADIIADFIKALLEGSGEEWQKMYEVRKGITKNTI